MKTPLRSARWKRSLTIAPEKYEAVSRAILATLSATPIRWGDLAKRVRARLPDFDASVEWYTIACLRELDTQRKVRRELRPPVLYSKRVKRS